MRLKCGIVGLPNVGKSTLFNALSNAKAEASNYPFCTIEPNVGVISVPDERLTTLSNLVNPEKTIPAVIEFVDIAGLVKGASQGEGLGNKFLSNIREVDAIIHVIRCFENDNIVHVSGRVNPIDDKEIIETELILKDLESLEKRLTKVEKVVKSRDKDAVLEYNVLLKLKSHLEKGQNARTLKLENKEEIHVNSLQLLTMKPILYVANVSEDDVVRGNDYSNGILKMASQENAKMILVSAAIESQIVELETDDDKKMFIDEFGLQDSGLNKLIQSAYSLLDLITYFTAGEKEVRAWTIKKGWTAPQAASVIHTDFEKGFIKAEVIKYQDYIKYQSELGCKEAGKLHIEGKEYTVEDGDILHFRFNV